jgi:hypothetical protein
MFVACQILNTFLLHRWPPLPAFQFFLIFFSLNIAHLLGSMFLFHIYAIGGRLCRPLLLGPGLLLHAACKPLHGCVHDVDEQDRQRRGYVCLCACVCVYVCVCVRVYIYMFIYTCIYRHIYVCVHLCINMYTHKRICIYMYVCVCVCVCVCVNIYVCMYIKERTEHALTTRRPCRPWTSSSTSLN